MGRKEAHLQAFLAVAFYLFTNLSTSTTTSWVGFFEGSGIMNKHKASSTHSHVNLAMFDHAPSSGIFYY